MLQNTFVVTDSQSREIKPHGNEAFPCAGYETVYSPRTKYVLPWHFHEEMELILVVRGNFRLRIPGVEYEMKKGDMAFINSGILHSAEGNPSCLNYAFVFRADFVTGGNNTAIAEKYISPLVSCPTLRSLVIRDGDRDRIKSFKKAFDALRNDSFGFELTVREELGRILLSIYESEEETIRNPGERDSDSVRLRAMLDFIHSSFSSPVTLHDISSAAAISDREALRCFRRTISDSPVQYLIKYRLMQSVNLMVLHPELSIGEIASSCGFESAAYYTKKFGSVYGVTPTFYRAQEIEKRDKSLFIE